MAASDALHPIEFQHHQAASPRMPIPPTAAPGQSHPELTDGSGMNAATLWSTTSALRTDTATTNAD